MGFCGNTELLQVMLDLFSTSVNHDDLVAAAPQVYELGDYSMEKLGVRQQASTQFDDQTHGKYPWQENLSESPQARPTGGRAQHHLCPQAINKEPITF
jgi:hypothetical protein